MADLTLATADALAKSRMASGTYTVAYAGYQKDGSGPPCIHALMPVTTTNGGGWTEVVDDA
jgi:hypothetical protein